jgi:endonuclease/exonuclease/phosphatase (EEP) superfamily protein YafD
MERQAVYLASLAPDLVLFQEVNRKTIDALCDRAGLSWLVCAVDIREPEPNDTPVRSRGVAIAGRIGQPKDGSVVTEAPLPERTLIADLAIDGSLITLASHHAPPGVNWKLRKPQQAVALARRLADITCPVVLGGDFNTPKVDVVDFAIA